MGRVRTKTVKRAAKVLLEKHYAKLTSDFHINKRILSEVAKVPTKSLRNKIAGFATHLIKRIQKGPVKGISLKVQEEERQRRLDWVPKQSDIKIDKVAIDVQTENMLKKRFGEDFINKISGNLEVKANQQLAKRGGEKGGRGGRKRDDNKRDNRGTRAPRDKQQKTENKGQVKEEGQPPATEGQQQTKREGRRKPQPRQQQ